MLKQDYIGIADVICNTYREQSDYEMDPRYLNPIIDCLVGKFIMMLEGDNNLFDTKKFKSYINKKIGRNIID